ncbi:hypothetical protein ON010_g10146 [Phytophthora cinnamomi]|nr:hypothetical protein ON010_g10146 [Phytophthora cinnamomi]
MGIFHRKKKKHKGEEKHEDGDKSSSSSDAGLPPPLMAVLNSDTGGGSAVLTGGLGARGYVFAACASDADAVAAAAVCIIVLPLERIQAGRTARQHRLLRVAGLLDRADASAHCGWSARDIVGKAYGNTGAMKKAYMWELCLVTLGSNAGMLYGLFECADRYEGTKFVSAGIISSLHADGYCVGQVILNVNSPTFTKLYSFKVPTKYAAWFELVITYLLVPKLPILAQGAGLVAGARVTSRMLSSVHIAHGRAYRRICLRCDPERSGGRRVRGTSRAAALDSSWNNEETPAVVAVGDEVHGFHAPTKAALERTRRVARFLVTWSTAQETILAF